MEAKSEFRVGRPDPAEGAGPRFREPYLPVWLLGLWAAFLTVASLQPRRIQQLGQGHAMHGTMHVLVFGMLGALAILTLSRRYRALGIVCSVSLGVLIEVMQAHLYPDAIEWNDVRDDTLGIVLFSCLTLAVLPLLRQLRGSN